MLILVAAAGMAFAQSMQGDIPFAFGVQDETYQAATYRVQVDVSGQRLYLMNKESQRQIIIPALFSLRNERLWSGANYYLTFRRYGDRSFLAGIVHDGTEGTVRQSRAEREYVTSRIVAERRPVMITVAAKLVK
jgi:hypothetical protein